jgi:hypothetical protein
MPIEKKDVSVQALTKVATPEKTLPKSISSKIQAASAPSKLDAGMKNLITKAKSTAAPKVVSPKPVVNTPSTNIPKKKSSTLDSRAVSINGIAHVRTIPAAPTTTNSTSYLDIHLSRINTLNAGPKIRIDTPSAVKKKKRTAKRVGNYKGLYQPAPQLQLEPLPEANYYEYYPKTYYNDDYYDQEGWYYPEEYANNEVNAQYPVANNEVNQVDQSYTYQQSYW